MYQTKLVGQPGDVIVNKLIDCAIECSALACITFKLAQKDATRQQNDP